MATYRRRNYLIDKPFQLRFALYVCSWLVALNFLYPFLVHHLISSVVDYVTHDPLGPPPEQVLHARTELLTIFWITQIVFAGVVFVVSIFLSHRIAGPIYKLRMFLRDVAAGRVGQALSFRKRDHFQPLAERYNEMMRQVLGRHEAFATRHASARKRLEQAARDCPHAETRQKLQQAIALL